MHSRGCLQIGQEGYVAQVKKVVRTETVSDGQPKEMDNIGLAFMCQTQAQSRRARVRLRLEGGLVG